MAAAAAAAAAPLGRAMVLAIARLARKADRVSDMYVLVKERAEMHYEFDSEERDILVTAFRGTFSPKIKELRVISALAKGGDDDPDNAEPVMFYRDVLEDGMQATCRETLDIVEKHLLPFSRVAENTALYTMIKADAYWILAMLKKEENKELLLDKALMAYEDASKAAESLSAAHPLRLAVNLTKTAFYFDVMEWPELATALAKQALDKAGPELASLDEESYKKSAEIMGLMEDNLKLWKKPTSPKSEDYSEYENNIISFSGLASLSLDEAGPSYTSGSPSPPPPSPPVVPRSADYSENGNDTSFNPASLEAGPSYSNGSPSPPPPVIPRSAGPPVASDEFISPGDWGYEFNEGLSLREIRYRKKAAQIKRGRMG